jgi:hypothetical protein
LRAGNDRANIVVTDREIGPAGTAAGKTSRKGGSAARDVQDRRTAPGGGHLGVRRRGASCSASPRAERLAFFGCAGGEPVERAGGAEDALRQFSCL